MNQFQVFGEVKLSVSVNVKAKNEDEAKRMAENQLHELLFVDAQLKLVKSDGEIIEPEVHDWTTETKVACED
ncbi:hypothetical protein NSQ41_12850 [Aeribacillus sp. FSL K6-8210]|uniref:hypothetical protein n=1 Tax=Aeribacillus sp. FSL K6-8210 TaxID=2954683 RepID=UPI0030CEE4A3